MEKLKLDKVTLKKFGVTMGIAFLIITVIILVRHKHSIIPTSIISLTFLILAFTLPALLKPIYIYWMKLAFILSWVNTRIILFILFYLFFAPVGLIMRLFRIDLLDKKIENEKKSYWIRKEKKEFNLLDYERRF